MALRVESESAFPVVLGPDGAAGDPAAAVAAARAQVDGLLERAGALLLRGFPIADGTGFAAVARGLGGKPMEYVGGNVPRTRVGSDVFTSTELDRRFRIQLHNELAYQRSYPDRIAFFCERPARTGGQTTIVDCRLVLRDIDPAVVAAFERRGIRYVRTFQATRPRREAFKKRFPLYYHQTWESAFGTGARDEVERACRELEMQFRWRPNGDLEVWNELPATIVHPRTGERIWFNQATNLHYNRRSLGWLVYLSRKLFYRGGRDHPYQIYFGDGSPVSRAQIGSVQDAIDRHTTGIDWQQGDLLVLDNRLVAHGRAPYSGNRRVLVSMLRG